MAVQHLNARPRSSTPLSSFTTGANVEVIFVYKERKNLGGTASQIDILSFSAARDSLVRDVLARMVGMVQKKFWDEGQDRAAGFIDL